MKKIKINYKGFGLIEILISASIIAIAFIAFVGFILFAHDATLKAQRNTEALASTEEAMEVVRKLRDISWTTNISPLVAGTTYFPKIVSGNWTLTTTNPTPTSFYTTKIVLSTVSRDANYDIAASGSTDVNTKKVIATTSWTEGGNKSVILTTYLTNYKNN